MGGNFLFILKNPISSIPVEKSNRVAFLYPEHFIDTLKKNIRFTLNDTICIVNTCNLIVIHGEVTIYRQIKIAKRFIVTKFKFKTFIFYITTIKKRRFSTSQLRNNPLN